MTEDLVVWDDSYSVGHEGMDYQHKDLVSMINDLFTFCNEKRTDNLEFFIMLKKAAAYTQIHFTDEEKYMTKANYPDLDEHKKEHAKFIATVEDTLKKFQEREAVPIELARFLKNWLLTHIAGSDKKYEPYLAKVIPH